MMILVPKESKNSGLSEKVTFDFLLPPQCSKINQQKMCTKSFGHEEVLKKENERGAFLQKFSKFLLILEI